MAISALEKDEGGKALPNTYLSKKKCDRSGSNKFRPDLSRTQLNVPSTTLIRMPTYSITVISAQVRV